MYDDLNGKYYFPSQTELCGWGVEAAESINKGEYIVEYIGEGKQCLRPISLVFFSSFFLPGFSVVKIIGVCLIFILERFM